MWAIDWKGDSMLPLVSHSRVRLCLEAAGFRLTYIVFSHPSPIFCGKAQETYWFPKMDIIDCSAGILYAEGGYLFMSFQEKVHGAAAYVRGLGTCVNSSCKGGWASETQHLCSGPRSNLISPSLLFTKRRGVVQKWLKFWVCEMNNKCTNVPKSRLEDKMKLESQWGHGDFPVVLITLFCFFSPHGCQSLTPPFLLRN